MTSRGQSIRSLLPVSWGPLTITKSGVTLRRAARSHMYRRDSGDEDDAITYCSRMAAHCRGPCLGPFPGTALHSPAGGRAPGEGESWLRGPPSTSAGSPLQKTKHTRLYSIQMDFKRWYHILNIVSPKPRRCMLSQTEFTLMKISCSEFLNKNICLWNAVFLPPSVLNETKLQLVPNPKFALSLGEIMYTRTSCHIILECDLHLWLPKCNPTHNCTCSTYGLYLAKIYQGIAETSCPPEFTTDGCQYCIITQAPMAQLTCKAELKLDS